MTFKANVQSNILLRINNPIEKIQFPMGSRIETQSGKLIGIMGQSNQSLLSSDIRHLNEPLEIIWGNQVKQSCMIPKQDFSQISTNKITQLSIVNVECH